MLLLSLVTASLAAAPGTAGASANATQAAALGRAADVAVYKRAVDLVAGQWLNAPSFSARTAFRDAGEAAEQEVEWLLADTLGDRMTLRDGTGSWRAEVTLSNAQDLPAALARVEDAVRGAGRPVPAEVDLRAELLTGVTHQLDRYSTVLHDSALARFDERLSGSLTGIGATLRSDAGGLLVTGVVPNGPAARAGMAADDRILRVDGVSTTGMRTADATARIRGAAGTSVTLVVRRPPSAATPGERVVTLKREAVEIRNVRARVGPGGVGIITIEHVSEQTRAWLDDALDELREQGGLREGLILDLRGNTGGSLLQSALAADAFLGEGTLVTTVDRNGKAVPGLVAKLEAHPDASPITTPMAVLVDGQTASGSEILAGALARLQRAVVIGTPTFGKGTVQKLYPLADAIKLKLTVAEYLVEGLQRVADVGLAPDVALEAVEVGEGRTWVSAPATRQNLAPTTPVLRYVVSERRDLAVELAAATLREAESADRATVLATLRAQAALFARTEDLALQAALRARAIDWSAGTPPSAPRAEIELRLSEPAVAGRPTEVTATLRNLGPAMRRSLVRLVSDAATWDDLVLPVGALASGATTTVRARVTPSARTPARSDDVQAWLEWEGGTPIRAGSGRLDILPAPPLHVGVRARLVPTPRAGLGRHEVVVEIRNTTPRTVDGVVARLDFPGTTGVELVTALSAPMGLAASGTARTTLALDIGPNAPLDTLRLRLRVTDDADREVELPLVLARSGAWAEVVPPEVNVGPVPTVARVGNVRITVRARDDGPIDHLRVSRAVDRVDRRRGTRRVTTERDKLAWTPVHARSLDTALDVPVRPGLNRYVVVVEDEGGVRTTREVCVWGEG